MNEPREAVALRLRRFSFTYAGAAKPALEEVDIEIPAGEFVVVAGSSAGGKSTLLRAACGLVPHFHGGLVVGEIESAGRDVLTSGPGELADTVGYLAQEPESQVTSTTVAAEIGLAMELRQEDATARARAVEEVALTLAIPHLLDRTVDRLSGGELQRVALAAALVTRPSLVLLDEPTSQLDPVAGDELIWLLRRLNAEWGVTVVVTEHRLERCLAAADRVLAIEGGRLEFDGEPGEFLNWATAARPALTTPISRMFSLAGITPLPTGVRQARLSLAGLGRRLPDRHVPGVEAASMRAFPGRALRSRDLWVELERDEEPVEVLRGFDLEIGAGERVVLLGRNGAGKSTFLKVAAGLIEPVRGRVELPRDMALLTQFPGDFLVRERVGDELPGSEGEALLAQLGLAGTRDLDPRDLSGGQRQRLALAIALAGRLGPESAPGLIALDEPTRGLDRDLKQGLARLCRELARHGSSVIVATHDVEFAAEFAERAVLMGAGRPIADGPVAEVLSGGWYFATEVSRVVGRPGVIDPQTGAETLARELGPRAGS